MLRLLQWIAARRPLRVIEHYKSPYLRRYYLCGRLPSWVPPELGRLTWLSHSVYLHNFARADSDHELHNHPSSDISLILTGGYTEERLVGEGAEAKIIERLLCAWDFNTIHTYTFHRISRLWGDTWTLFAQGPEVQDWGFRSSSGEFIPWEVFVERQR